VEDALDSVIMPALNKGIEVICVTDPRMPPKVRGDGDRLKQVVLNLLSNAIKFTPGFTEGGEVEVRTELGGAVQVDPITPTLKAPGTKRLKLKYHKLLSSFAFNCNLRRYSW